MVRGGRGHEAKLGGHDAEDLRLQRAPRGLLGFYSLLSIARKPMRGYDLMREIDLKTDGAWRPGPGAVYPVLQKLSRQGLIEARRSASGGPARIVYRITQAGLGKVADAKTMMRTSTERMNLMTSLFLDLMDPEDLVRLVLGVVDTQIELVHAVVDGGKGPLSDQDKLFVLRQYRLNLERELARSGSSIDRLGSVNRARRPVARGTGGRRGEG